MTNDREETKLGIRITKAGKPKPKSGVVAVTGEGDKPSYRCACDGCGTMVSLPFKPYENKVVTCKTCKWAIEKGKPSVRVQRRGEKITYVTLCDKCGSEQQTPFLPKKERKFLCDSCHRNEPQRRSHTIKEGVQVLGTKEEPLYWVPCDRCRTKVKLKFAPGENESFLCQGCFGLPQAQSNKGPKSKENRNPAGTRIFFNLECVVCGKKETVDFVPQSLSEALCASCFDTKKRRKHHGKNH